MKGKRITKRVVDALRCPQGQDRVFLWDTDVRGFGVTAMPSGKKIYVLQYRQGGRSRRLKIGEHGPLTPEEARRAAEIARGKVLGGADPIDARKLERGARTFKAIAADYQELHVGTKRKASTKDDYERLLRLHLLPKLGNRQMVNISADDVRKIHQGMSATPGAANRSLALVSAIWNWGAKAEGFPVSARNPAQDIEPYPEHSVERYLTAAEASRLGAALHLAETKGIPWAVNEKTARSKHQPKTKRETVLDPMAVVALRLIIFTGARLREILHAKWRNLDQDRGIIFLDDSKRGRRDGRKIGRKPIYLSSAVMALIANIPRVGDDPHIIVGGKEHRTAKGARIYKPRADLKRPWAAIRRAARLDAFRLHDLRHTFASTGVGSSLGLPIIGKLLGHARPETTARYAHLDSDPMRRAADLIGNQITAAMAKRPRD